MLVETMLVYVQGKRLPIRNQGQSAVDKTSGCLVKDQTTYIVFYDSDER